MLREVKLVSVTLLALASFLPTLALARAKSMPTPARLTVR